MGIYENTLEMNVKSSSKHWTTYAIRCERYGNRWKCTRIIAHSFANQDKKHETGYKKMLKKNGTHWKAFEKHWTRYGKPWKSAENIAQVMKASNTLRKILNTNEQMANIQEALEAMKKTNQNCSSGSCNSNTSLRKFRLLNKTVRILADAWEVADKCIVCTKKKKKNQS